MFWGSLIVPSRDGDKNAVRCGAQKNGREVQNQAYKSQAAQNFSYNYSNFAVFCVRTRLWQREMLEVLCREGLSTSPGPQRVPTVPREAAPQPRPRRSLPEPWSSRAPSPPSGPGIRRGGRARPLNPTERRARSRSERPSPQQPNVPPNRRRRPAATGTFVV